MPQRVTEPVSFLILPFLPGALGMALARLFGLGALGCLYGGRLVNLLAYTALCYAALRSAHKCRSAFLCIMLMPMSLYMGASLSYDATLLGCYYLMLALLTRDEWNDKTALFYALACVFANRHQAVYQSAVGRAAADFTEIRVEGAFQPRRVRRTDRCGRTGADPRCGAVRHAFAPQLRRDCPPGRHHRERRCAAAVCFEKSAALHRGFAGHTV